ncbi:MULTISPECIES: type II toxin-antitoxin system PemK/MazF family toxin [unclassified Methanoculleus]|jgi:mRNA interferase MazF|uniref:type II toxin-antitoxin system PemK/MazF family toxin n=1 Tax=unclassified Methanoculleus TaxID=2619537 RepID=UPI0025D5D140|nr:type II toxin-antitoxin system PemK/MazF family toxin [Methanoculleus sp. UBA377]
MGRYNGGDVVLASVRIGGTGEGKVRPVVVVTAEESGNLVICPVSSSPSTDGISIPLSLDDFARGGLDLFTESYALTAYPAVIRPADVVGKKGTLLPGTLAAIREAMPTMHRPLHQGKRFRY